MTNFQELEKIIEYEFINKKILFSSLCHSSVKISHSSDIVYDFQVLEFFGDRILSFLVAQDIVYRFSHLKEGQISYMCNELVSRDSCHQVALNINLDSYVLCADNIDIYTTSILSDTCEALIGAIFIDSQDIEIVNSFYKKHWITKKKINTYKLTDLKDTKSTLYEWCDRNKINIHNYMTVQQKGLDHMPIFFITLDIPGYPTVKSKASSKNKAIKSVAKIFINCYLSGNKEKK